MILTMVVSISGFCLNFTIGQILVVVELWIFLSQGVKKGMWGNFTEKWNVRENNRICFLRNSVYKLSSKNKSTKENNEKLLLGREPLYYIAVDTCPIFLSKSKLSEKLLLISRWKNFEVRKKKALMKMYNDARVSVTMSY